MALCTKRKPVLKIDLDVWANVSQISFSLRISDTPELFEDVRETGLCQRLECGL